MAGVGVRELKFLSMGAIMAKLSDDQKRFLSSQNIPYDAVFDATGMAKANYQAAMKAEGKLFAYGVSPCGAGGHSLRTRSGHCIQCDTAKISYILRHYSSGYVYVAGSLSKKVLKVGTTTYIQQRQQTLSKEGYGGATDWKILAKVECKNAGQIEKNVQARLSKWSVPGEYYKGWDLQSCYELFRCDFEDIILVMRGLNLEVDIIGKAELERNLARYKFSKLC